MSNNSSEGISDEHGGEGGIDDRDGLGNVDGDGQPENDHEGSDFLSWTDAGVGEELQTGKSETERTVLKIVENRAEDKDKAEQIRKIEPDIIKRAKALAGIGAIAFPDETVRHMGGAVFTKPDSTDENRWAVFDAIFGDGEERPHIDTFKGRFVDWQGRVVDDRYPIKPVVEACAAAGLKAQSAEQVRKAFKEWAMTTQVNDLIKRFNATIPEWDGVPRMEMSLIELFSCFDTELNREFSFYFWLSLYCRVTHPGCQATMALSLFGAQNAGKSYFSKLICQIITGDDESDAVQLDLSADKNDFLREITGNSIIANVGEMVGFGKADLNKVKTFMSKTLDNMNYKYEGHFVQLRQWIVVMDGNSYSGLQRDDTGNRRFYPMFVGQLPDKNGQPNWATSYSADFTGFRNKVWQIMAEARVWMSKNGGIEGYNKLFNSVSKKVEQFSRDEMAKDRGTIRDDSLDAYLTDALRIIKPRVIAGTKYKGLFVASGEIETKLAIVSRNKVNLNWQHLPPKMAVFGAEKRCFGKDNGYFFSGMKDEKEYLLRINGPVDEEYGPLGPSELTNKYGEF